MSPIGFALFKFYFNWNLALPLILLFIGNAVSLWRNLGMCLSLLWQQTTTPELVEHFKGLDLGWIWSIYNLVLIGIALLILLDAPKADVYEWFDLRRVVRLDIGEKTAWGVTTMISEVGAEIALTQQIPIELLPGQSVNLEITEENLQLNAEVLRTGIKDEFLTIRVKFPLVTVPQHRRLVQMLFCRPGQWKHKFTPGEFQSFILLFKILLKPRILFDRKADVNAVMVSKD